MKGEVRQKTFLIDVVLQSLITLKKKEDTFSLRQFRLEMNKSLVSIDFL